MDWTKILFSGRNQENLTQPHHANNFLTGFKETKVINNEMTEMTKDQNKKIILKTFIFSKKNQKNQRPVNRVFFFK